MHDVTEKHGAPNGLSQDHSKRKGAEITNTRTEIESESWQRPLKPLHVRRGKNSTRSPIACCVSLLTIDLPSFFRIPSSPTRYRTIIRGRRLTPSRTNNTKKQSILKHLFYIAQYISHTRIVHNRHDTLKRTACSFVTYYVKVLLSRA